ncbi:hypothetical protein GA0115233_102510 [Streptomyces sp. DI166]|jgi:hypothetical protein|nr:hypothetical protein GA0115233_102510 [Streptomyces sp. DI166]
MGRPEFERWGHSEHLYAAVEEEYSPADELEAQPLLRGKQVWFRLSNTADGVVAEGQC